MKYTEFSNYLILVLFQLISHGHNCYERELNIHLKESKSHLAKKLYSIESTANK